MISVSMGAEDRLEVSEGTYDHRDISPMPDGVQFATAFKVGPGTCDCTRREQGRLVETESEESSDCCEELHVEFGFGASSR